MDILGFGMDIADHLLPDKNTINNTKPDYQYIVFKDFNKYKRRRNALCTAAEADYVTTNLLTTSTVKSINCGNRLPTVRY